MSNQTDAGVAEAASFPRRRYSIQLPYLGDTMLDFGSPGYNDATVEHFVHSLLARHNGQSAGGWFNERNNTNAYVTFANDDDAIRFLCELHEKLAPRMFSTDANGKSAFVNYVQFPPIRPEDACHT